MRCGPPRTRVPLRASPPLCPGSARSRSGPKCPSGCLLRRRSCPQRPLSLSKEHQAYLWDRLPQSVFARIIGRATTHPERCSTGASQREHQVSSRRRFRTHYGRPDSRQPVASRRSDSDLGASHPSGHPVCGALRTPWGVQRSPRHSIPILCRGDRPARLFSHTRMGTNPEGKRLPPM